MDQKQTYRTVMLTTDGSELASAAIPHAAYLAALAGGRVVVVAVVDSEEELLLEGRSSGWVDIGRGLDPAEAQAAVSAERAEAAHYLEHVQRALDTAGAGTVALRTVEGSPGPAIVQAAEDLNCDVIVMSTHGRSGLRRALIGSVADHVVRHAHRPVLLVRAGDLPPG